MFARLVLLAAFREVVLASSLAVDGPGREAGRDWEAREREATGSHLSIGVIEADFWLAVIFR
ncbi:MAG: hypothetical protein M3R69_15330 [Acidobacteriota bacterium]|nr:hypothetical protein [Acidobacteriota bacterium]